jgi:ectoine hydroxylase-related dioxygenase (phytanoyl-CoA dioxygenase family)
MIDFKYLETTGFLVIPNFLNVNEINLLIRLIDSRKSNDSRYQNKNYKTFGITSRYVQQKINQLIQQIQSTTDIQANIMAPGCGVFDNTLIKFPWHQDHEPYYMFQDLYNSLNFWIPIIKPDSTKSGLSLIPFNKLLPQISDSVSDRILGKGATRFVPTGNTTLMNDDESGQSDVLPVNIESFMESPELFPGDLLILRGDTIHRTQDNLTYRVSIGARAYNKNTVINKEQFLKRCDKKQDMISNNPGNFLKIESKLQTIEQLSILDLIKILNEK